MKKIAKKLFPGSLWKILKRLKRFILNCSRKTVEILGYNISKTSDYYSPLPTQSQLHKNFSRWNKPSSMAGIRYDVEKYKKLLKDLLDNYLDEFIKLPDYIQIQTSGFGPGYTKLDALILYMMIREIKPKRYLEIGSGLSTYYCALAVKENFKEANPCKILCVEPLPFRQLYSIPNIEVIKNEVQNVDKETFLELAEGDILFVDSSHILKIDGDVPSLYLEILPILKSGMIIHIHDIPFPYNIPYPPEYWVLCKNASSPYWPMYWNEAMLLQAFLAFNDSFEIIMSTPLIRHQDEMFLKNNIPFYKTIKEEPNTFSSLWLRKVK